MSWVVAVLSGIGVVCILQKRNLLGVLMGIQLFLLASTIALVLSGAQDVGIVSTVLGLLQLASALAIATRLQFLKKHAEMQNVRELRN